MRARGRESKHTQHIKPSVACIKTQQCCMHRITNRHPGLMCHTHWPQCQYMSVMTRHTTHRRHGYVNRDRAVDLQSIKTTTNSCCQEHPLQLSIAVDHSTTHGLSSKYKPSRDKQHTNTSMLLPSSQRPPNQTQALPSTAKQRVAQSRT